MCIDEMKKKLSEDLTENRYKHSINVMNETVKLAEIYGVDKKKAMVAGLLHDCGKLKREKVGALEHAGMGAKLLKTRYNIDDVDVENAILYHTTGREAMTILEKIIYIADKIEIGRDYEGVDSIRAEAYINIDNAIVLSLENTIAYLNKMGIKIDQKSQNTLEFYKNK